MIANYRPLIAVFSVILAAGCQTASLEDAAPRAAVVEEPDAAPATVDTADATNSDQQSAAVAAEQVSGAPQVIRRNPGIMSIVPIEKTTAVEPRDFVAEGARRTGQYPSFGREPQAANSQMTAAEKLAAEAEMAELLRNRAATPGARAQYEARLRRLRQLAASHGRDTQQEIEK